MELYSGAMIKFMKPSWKSCVLGGASLVSHPKPPLPNDMPTQKYEWGVTEDGRLDDLKIEEYNEQARLDEQVCNGQQY
jgi:hypothetical protein